MNKVIFLDWGIFVHTGIFLWIKNRNIPPTYTALSMIIGCLKKIELNEDDIIIVAVDSPKGSWRKEVDSNYKANRKEARKKIDINWDEQYGKFRDLLENLDLSTPFNIIEIEKLEADDIIACGVRHYSNKECIIISTDGDYEQLTRYENVKIFSPKTKKYKIVRNPYVSLEKKIQKEVSDNLITPIITEADYKKREKIVSLIKLPEEIESQVEAELQYVKNDKEYDNSKIWYKSIKSRFPDIYNNDKIVKISDSFKKKKKKSKKEDILTLDKY